MLRDVQELGIFLEWAPSQNIPTAYTLGKALSSVFTLTAKVSLVWSVFRSPARSNSH